MTETLVPAARLRAFACDVFVAIGSSLVVWPAAGFPLMAKRNGARLIIVNREPTEFDEIADLVARLALAPAELPIGIVTAFIGAPFFLYLLLRGRA